jgi:UDP-glucose 4-epimerase
MLEAARTQSVKKFIFASSGAPVGEVTPPIHEELAPHPVSPYGASKLAGEGYCSAYHNTFGIETAALRFGNVYGPRSNHKSSVVAKFIRQALKGETLEIYGDGNQTRDFIFIDDLIEAIMLAYTKENIGGEVFQIATNAETTVQEMANQLVKIMDRRGLENINVMHSEPRLGDVFRNYSDTSKAANILDWKVQTNLEDGLKKTIDWFLDKSV